MVAAIRQANPGSKPACERCGQRHRIWIGPVGKRLNIPRIWGEATVNSASFYENLLAVRPVQDLFVIEAQEMAAITKRQKKIRNPALVSKATSELP